VTAASPETFNVESFTQLGAPGDLAGGFDTPEYARWNGFRAGQDSRYIALTCPRMLLREPYGKATVPVKAFDYEERVDGTDHDRYLWGNAAWALGARIAQAFSRHGWCAAIHGAESGGLVEGLPVHSFRTDSGVLAMTGPTEMPISERREKQLAELGFVPLVHRKGTEKAAFFIVQSAQKKVYDTSHATPDTRIPPPLPYILAVSRFAHYLKAIMCDGIGAATSRDEAERLLNDWIAGYVIASDDVSYAEKARHPLREARIEVAETPGRPGSYQAVAFLRPHFQLGDLGYPLRLVVDLPSATQQSE
jgi:type VI secretion system protein ImpC